MDSEVAPVDEWETRDVAYSRTLYQVMKQTPHA